MAKRWSINEDIIICKYCVENPWAYSSDEDVDGIATKLEAAGFSPRSIGAIIYELLSKCLILVDFKWIAVEGFKEFFKLVRGNHIIVMVVELVEEHKEVS